MIHGELGATPYVDIKSRMLTFSSKLCSECEHIILNTIYSLLYALKA